MTTLAIGSSVTLSVGDGGSFNLSTGGGLASVTVTPTVGAVSVVNLGALAERRTIGPFAEGASVVVANISCASLDYDYSAAGVLTAAQVVATQALVSGAGFIGGDPTQATQNTALMLPLLAAGGNIAIPGNLGTVYFNKAIEVRSNTTLTAGLGTFLGKAPGQTMFVLVRNYSCPNIIYLSGRTINNGLLTIPESGHSRNIGDVIYIERAQGNASLNGPQTIVAIVDHVAWTIAASGANPTNGAIIPTFVSRYNPKPGASFVRNASNVVTVTDAGHSRVLGDRMWIAGLGGSATFNGVAEVSAVVLGVSWSYVNTGGAETATGTAQVLGDRNIAVDYSIDGNYQNLSYTQSGSHATRWVNITGLTETIRDSKNCSGGRVSDHSNITDNWIPYGKSGQLNSVLVQHDSYCDRVSVGTLLGAYQNDDLLAWGVTDLLTGIYADTASPCGPGSMGTLTVGWLHSYSPTGLFKMYSFTGYDLGRIHIGKVSGIGAITIGDPGAGVTGGSITSLIIDDIDILPTTASTSQVLLGGAAFSTMGKVHFGRIVDNASATDSGYIINFSAPAAQFTIGKLISKINRTGTGIIFASPLPLFKVDELDVSTGVGGRIFLANGASGVVDAMQVSHMSVTGSGNTAGQVIYGQLGGYFKTIQIANLVADNCGGIIGSNSAGFTHNWYISNARLFNVASGFGSDVGGTFNVNCANVDCSSVSNNLLQFYTAATTVRFVGRGIKHPAAQFALMTSTTSYSIDCQEAKIDLGANAGAPPSQLVPLAGDMITNTNATGGGVYGRTTAGAWLKVF